MVHYLKRSAGDKIVAMLSIFRMFHDQFESFKLKIGCSLESEKRREMVCCFVMGPHRFILVALHLKTCLAIRLLFRLSIVSTYLENKIPSFRCCSGGLAEVLSSVVDSCFD